MFFFFFFSSRRRHTRYWRDWSSDVCSSDLHGAEFVFGLTHGLGWIAMCLLSVAALRARVIPLRLAVAVAVIGAVGPFVGSYEFVREGRRRPRSDGTPAAYPVS